MADDSDRPAPGPQVLVLRAVFVPDGEPPPPEFLGDMNPLRIRATLDPATGELTCDNTGMSMLGDLRAEWHPDQGQDADEAHEQTGDDATQPDQEATTPDK